MAIINYAVPVATVRAWSFADELTSVRVGDKTYKKDFLHPTRDALPDLLDQLALAGFDDPRPSSYAWPWHKRVRTPRTSITTENVMFERFGRCVLPNSWQESFPGRSREEKRNLHGDVLKGDWSLYDIRSAYAWAASRPIPDTRYGVHVKRPTGTPGRCGMFLVEDPEFTAPVVPPRFRGALRTRRYWMTGEELEALDVVRPKILAGFEYTRSLDLRPELDWFRENFPEETWKKVFRAFWGAWRGAERPKQLIIKGGAVSSERDLPTIYRNPVLSSFVVSRVNLRILPWAKAAAHVYSDSVMVPHAIPTGEDVGDWKLVRTFHDEAVVTGAGNWGDAKGPIKHAGRKEVASAAGGMDGG